MSPVSAPEVIKYRNIPECYGGTFPLIGSSIGPIGTRDCHTCVGLFFRIGPDRCFVAHINASVDDGTGYTDWERKVQGEEGLRLEEMVLSKLRSAAHAGGWESQEVDASTIIMVCPLPEAPRTGYFVINAIALFFGGRVGHQNVQRRFHGFVYDDAISKTYLLPSEGWDGDVLENEWEQEVEDRPHRFVAEYEESAEANWAPEVRRE